METHIDCSSTLCLNGVCNLVHGCVERQSSSSGEQQTVVLVRTAASFSRFPIPPLRVYATEVAVAARGGLQVVAALEDDEKQITHSNPPLLGSFELPSGSFVGDAVERGRYNRDEGTQFIRYDSATVAKPRTIEQSLISTAIRLLSFTKANTYTDCTHINTQAGICSRNNNDHNEEEVLAVEHKTFSAVP